MGDVRAGDGCAGVGLCPRCNQRAMADAFGAVAGAPADACPSCGQPVDPNAPVRMTEVHFHVEGRPYDARELLNAIWRAG